MRRLYFSQLAVGSVMIGGSEAHHGRDVLRLSPGDAIELFDGHGHYGPATVDRIDRSQITATLRQILSTEPDRPRITLATAVPKLAHQEELVRMTTQIGLSIYQPVVFRRSSVREQFRLEKWRRWTLEACKQSGTNYLPEVREPVAFDDLWQTLGPDDRVVVGDVGKTGTSECLSRLPADESVVILIGPEGGFDPQETQTIEKNNALVLSIGSHTLRIETAAVTLCGIVRFLTSDNQIRNFGT